MPPLRAVNLLQSKEGSRLHGPELDQWRRWGPYLSERQWGTVREDYSEYGTAWTTFRTIMRAAACTAEARMALPDSATTRSTCASRLHSGTGTIRSLRNGSSG